MYWYQPSHLTFLNIAFTVKLLFQVIMQHLDQEKNQRLPFFSAFFVFLYFRVYVQKSVQVVCHLLSVHAAFTSIFL